ncbi:MAG TPA: hypothetical protein VG435_13550 [Acidimicrobiales bacterium]|jgi:hypothetical protein|nr:hypothetical protein [Acidimicrobiales bacterium]
MVTDERFGPGEMVSVWHRNPHTGRMECAWIAIPTEPERADGSVLDLRVRPG